MRIISTVVSITLAGCSLDGRVSGLEPPPDFSPAPAVDRGRNVTDVYVHKIVTPMADVLWIIDGSCSMTDDLAILAEHFPSFMAIIDGSNVDYRVAVTGTDLQRLGVLMNHNGKKWIDRETVSPVNAYVSMTGSAGNGGASGYNFDSTHACLHHETGDCIRSGFRRDDAPLHSIVVTDERDTSDIGKDGFVQFYRRLDDHPPNRVFSGILDPRSTSAYIQAIEEIGGTFADVNTTDWAELLVDFAEQSRDTAEKREFYLTQLPVPETISVEMRPIDLGDVVTPALAEDEWLYDPFRNSVWVDTDQLPEGDYRAFLTYDVRTTLVE